MATVSTMGMVQSTMHTTEYPRVGRIGVGHRAQGVERYVHVSHHASRFTFHAVRYGVSVRSLR